jgi:hypothetical protein
MLILSGSVGKRSLNRVHDVAVVQAALKQIRGRNGRPLWPGAITGKASEESLSAAIAGFESKINRRISGVIAPGGDANALSGMLPNNYKDMHGVPGTDIVAGHVARRTPKPDGGVEALALPDEYKDALDRIVTRLKDALNWLPTVRLGPIDAQGRCEVTVDLGLRFLDAHGRIGHKTAPLPGAVASEVARALGQPGRFSPPSRLSCTLPLKSREPLCFPPAQLAGGSNAWPLFTGNVGKGGGNAIQDVACLQAALANVQMPGTPNAFWTNGIDGKASNSLNDALTTFQRAAGLDETGGLKPGDATVKALSALLPSEFKGLRGVRGIATAKVGDDGGRGGVLVDALPEHLRSVLAPVDAELRKQHSIGLVLREKPWAIVNRVQINASLGGGHYLDERARLMADEAAPPAVHAAIKAVLGREKRVQLDPNASGGLIVLSLGGLTDEGEPIAIDYGNSEWFTVIQLPPQPKTGIGPEDEATGNIVTLDMLVAAGYEASKAHDIIREFGVGGTLRWHDGASGNRFLIIRGHGGRLGLIDELRHAQRHSAVIAMGVMPKGAARVRMTASGIGIVLIGAIEMHQFLTGEQDIVETVINMGFGFGGLAISSAFGTGAAFLAGALFSPAWVPLATLTVVGFAVGMAYNHAMEETELDAEVERLIRHGIEHFDEAAVFSDANAAP